MSLELTDISDILREHLADKEPEVYKAILKDLIAVDKEVKEAASADKVPRPKTKMVIMLRGDAGLKRLVEAGGWVLKVPEESDTTTLIDRIARAAREHNDSLRGKNRASKVIRTFARAFEYLRPKIIARVDAAFKIATRTLVEVVVIDREVVTKEGVAS